MSQIFLRLAACEFPWDRKSYELFSIESRDVVLNCKTLPTTHTFLTIDGSSVAADHTAGVRVRGGASRTGGTLTDGGGSGACPCGFLGRGCGECPGDVLL